MAIKNLSNIKSETIKDRIKNIITLSNPGDCYNVDKKYVATFTNVISELGNNNKFISYTSTDNKRVFIHLHTPKKYVKKGKKYNKSVNIHHIKWDEDDILLDMLNEVEAPKPTYHLSDQEEGCEVDSKNTSHAKFFDLII